MGVWIEYKEVIVGSVSGDHFAHNSPPNSVVSVMLVLIVISGLLYRLRRSLRLTTAELIFIYTALLIATPLMTQGLWQRLFAVVAAVPHSKNVTAYEALPSMLWPHGKNLVANGRFKNELQGFAFNNSGTLGWETVEWRNGTWKCPVLSANDSATAKPTIITVLNRYDAHGKEVIVPGESYLFTCLIRSTQMSEGSLCEMKMQAGGPPRALDFVTNDSQKTFQNPSGLYRHLAIIDIPKDLDKQLTLSISHSGPGAIMVHDVEFMNVMAVEGGYTGRKMIRAKDWAKLGPNERDFTVIKPDNMFSLAGLQFLVSGFIPWGQWVQPLIAWLALIGALFLGFFGFNVIMRKQWVENERFTFPMNIFPREFFAEETDANGRPHLTIFANRFMWLGFAITLPLVILKGLHFYIPGIPGALFSSDIWTAPTIDAQLGITNPILRAYLTDVRVTLVFSLLAIMLLVEKDILFSIWFTFLLYHLMPMFGRMFNFNRFPEYPWQWQQSLGSTIGYALVGIIAARQHLWKVIKHIFGKKQFDDSHEIVSYRVAAICIIVSIAMLTGWGIWTHIGWKTSVFYLGFMLMLGFMASRLRAECGPAFGYWTPTSAMMLISALGGFAVFGSTGMLVAVMIGAFLTTSVFYFIPPVQLEMLELARHYKIRQRDIGHALFIGLIGGVVIGGLIFLAWTYGKGANNLKFQFPYEQSWQLNRYNTPEASINREFLDNKIGLNPESRAFDVVHNVNARGVAIGIVVTGLLAFLRSTFMWFPIHPLGYVLAISYFGITVWFTCFVAWLIRSIVLRVGGAHTVRRGLIPFSVGMFLACIVSIIIFDIVGLYLSHVGVTDFYKMWP